VLATAIYGRAAGLAVEAVVFPQPLTDHVRTQLAADVAAGAKLRRTRSYLGVPTALLGARRGAFWIAGGGSSPLGTLGWMSAACELERQVACGELSQPDLIYVALGSGGTAAGLIAGFAGAATPPRVVAVRVVDRVVANASATRRLARRTRALAGLAAAPLAPLVVDHRFFGGGYGCTTAAADAAVARAAAHGLTLEPTYTGKAMAALLADAAAGLLDGKRVLFVHSYNGADLAPLLSGNSPAKL
jgi:D-cysteine desulfhydrase